jgi:hypothetical protein
MPSITHISHPPCNVAEAAERVDTALQTAAYAARICMNSTMKMSPGGMAFHRDMVLNIPLIVDLNFFANDDKPLLI